MKKVTLIFSFAFLLIFTNTTSVLGNTTNQLDIEVETKIPDTYLFHLSNLKPGDRVFKKLTVQNRGKRDFTYYTDSRFIEGSEKLYNEFLLEIKSADQTLFQGKLKDFHELEPRFLESMHEEDLLLRVEFPYELGNEFQGLGFDMEFLFIVADDDPGPNPNPNPDPDPNPNPNPDPDPDPNPDPDPDPDPNPNPDPDPDPNPNPDPDPDPNNPDNPDNPDEPTDPNNPDDPDNSDDPTNPNNPNNPDNPSDPNNPGTNEPPLSPSRPISDNDASIPADGKILPSTSTDMYNNLLIGGILVVIGGLLIVGLRWKLRKSD